MSEGLEVWETHPATGLTSPINHNQILGTLLPSMSIGPHPLDNQTKTHNIPIL